MNPTLGRQLKGTEPQGREMTKALAGTGGLRKAGGYYGGGSGGSSRTEKVATHVVSRKSGAPSGNGRVVISW
jgi:hypothetical protein